MNYSQQNVRGDKRNFAGRICIWGLFGQGNIGNECTLEALVANIRTRLPAAELLLICTDPKDAAPRHHLPAIPISAAQQPNNSNAPKPSKLILPLRVCRRILIEFSACCKAFKALKSTDLLAMTGTGMLTDYNCSPFGRPYEILKWSLIAKLRRCNVRFISVGVGPLNAFFSRFFIKLALRLADYRCYRDNVSKSRMQSAGFDTRHDFIFPDLAFSLLKEELPPFRDCNLPFRSVGVGVMDYYGQQCGLEDGEILYQDYLEKTADFIAWLLNHGYKVRILHGDTRFDATPRQDLRAKLEARGFSYTSPCLQDDDISSASDLLSTLATLDLVVSPRFHNQLLALILERPVISISYDPKSDALLEGLGLARYCQPIEDLDVNTLIQHVKELETTFQNLRPGIAERVDTYRHLLDQQYRMILGGLGNPVPHL